MEVMDFIIKGYADEVTSRVKSCVNIAYERYSSMSIDERRIFKVLIGSKYRSFHYENICFIESTGREHRLTLHTLEGQEEFRGNMKDIELSNPNLLRCHRAYLVNIENVEKYDEEERVLLMKNGEICHVATRKEGAVKRELKRKARDW
jgi:two-component system response regulator AgrA